jgi:hypothetical protein
MAKDPDPANFDDPDKLRRIANNARRLGRTDFVRNCQARIAELAGAAYEDAIESEFWQALAIAEELAAERNGKATRMTQTRQKHTRQGVVKCLEDIVSKDAITEAFTALIAAGKPELVFEAIVLRHSELFSEGAIQASTQKLESADVDVSEFAQKDPEPEAV